MAIDFTDPKWHFEERVSNLINRGRTKQEAEEIVKWVNRAQRTGGNQ